MLKLDQPDDDSHIIEWSIENFSNCNIEHGEELECPVSTAGKLFHTRWTLEIWPRGYENPNFLGCSLAREGDEKDGPETMHVEVAFSVMTFDGVEAYTKRAKWEFRRQDSCGFPEFLKLEDIFCRKEFLLPSDILTLRCTLRMLGPKYKQTSKKIFTTEFPIQKLATRMTLDNIRGTTKQNPRIFDFPVSNDLLSLKVSMNKDETFEAQTPEAPVAGQTPESPEFLHIVITKKEWEYPVHVFCRIKVLNNKLGVVFHNKFKHLFSNTDEEEWILPYFIDTNKLNPDCIENGSLLLDFEFILCDHKPRTLTVANMTSLPSRADPEASTIKKTLEDLYETRKYSDVILMVGEETFPAHKAILAARSPTFREIFTSFVGKHIQVIVDVDKDTMELLLKFIYTDTMEDMSDEECLLLYSAAQKYRISSLQCRCVKFLAKNLSIEAVYKALVIAEEWNDTLLKLVALDHILDNYESALLTPEWQTFTQEHKEIANLVTRHVEFKQRLQSEG